MGLGRCGGIGVLPHSTCALCTSLGSRTTDQTAEEHRGQIGEKRSSISHSQCQLDRFVAPPVTVGVRESTAVVAQSRRGYPARFATRGTPLVRVSKSRALFDRGGAASHLAKFIC